MTKEITKDQEWAFTRCEATGVLVAEASCLEWPVGQWPTTVFFQGDEYVYFQADRSDSGEDLAGVRYRQRGQFNPQELLIIND